MGMSASQLNLLFYTNRKNDIGQQLSCLSNEKVSLTRDMQRVSREYQNALNQKTLKWSNNSGVSYVDLSYNNLMKPSSMNQNKPYLLTDLAGRVVIDSAYKEYAEMISANGGPGNWENVRTKVLSSITGIDAEDIDKSNELQEKIWASEEKINDLIDEEPSLIETSKTTLGLLKYTEINNIGSGTFSDSKCKTWYEAYNNGATIKLGKDGAIDTLKSVVNALFEGLEPYFDEEESEKLEAGRDAFLNDYETYCDGDDTGQAETLKNGNIAISGSSSGGYTVNVQMLVDAMLSTVPTVKGDEGNEMFSIYALNNPNYEKRKDLCEQWQEDYDTEMENYNKLIEEKSLLLTADEEALLKFYDGIFSAIAEKGWVYNVQVDEPDYLNQMLQNNAYTLTTVDRDVEYDEKEEDHIWKNQYDTDIASNFNNIFIMNDQDAREEALAKYEHEKGLINLKDSKLETRMKNLETEQSAINQMIKSIETVLKDSTENLNVFG